MYRKLGREPGAWGMERGVRSGELEAGTNSVFRLPTPDSRLLTSPDPVSVIYRLIKNEFMVRSNMMRLHPDKVHSRG